MKNNPRSLSSIAREIRRDWNPIYFAAKPYVQAMASLDSIEDDYTTESGRGIVLGFLTNASTWRGDTARRIKAELNAMVKAPSARRNPSDIGEVYTPPGSGNQYIVLPQPLYGAWRQGSGKRVALSSVNVGRNGSFETRWDVYHDRGEPSDRAAIKYFGLVSATAKNNGSVRRNPLAYDERPDQMMGPYNSLAVIYNEMEKAEARMLETRRSLAEIAGRMDKYGDDSYKLHVIGQRLENLEAGLSTWRTIVNNFAQAYKSK